MNTEHLRAWRISPHYLLVALLLTAVALAAVLVQTQRAHAAVGGEAGTVTVPNTWNGETGTGVYAALTADPTISEGASDDIPVGDMTPTLNAPAGWEFDTTATLTVTGGGADITVKLADVTDNTTITLSVTAVATDTSDTLTIEGITARPIASTAQTSEMMGQWVNDTDVPIDGLSDLEGLRFTRQIEVTTFVAKPTVVAANGTATSTITVTNHGMGSPASVDIIRFTAVGGVFANGSAITTKAYSARLVATAKLSSATAGAASVVVTNESVRGDAADDLTALEPVSVTFFGIPTETGTEATVFTLDDKKLSSTKAMFGVPRSSADIHRDGRGRQCHLGRAVHARDDGRHLVRGRHDDVCGPDR